VRFVPVVVAVFGEYLGGIICAVDKENNVSELAVLVEVVEKPPCDEIVYRGTLFRRRLLTLLSGSCGVEEDKGTASAVPDTNDSAGCVWLGIV
jgi:hypothetical protein